MYVVGWKVLEANETALDQLWITAMTFSSLWPQMCHVSESPFPHLQNVNNKTNGKELL